MKYADALEIASQFYNWLAPVCVRREIVGSVKRRKADGIGDIELLLIADTRPPIAKFGQGKIYKTRIDEYLAKNEPPLKLTTAKKKADGPSLKRFALSQFSTWQDDFYLELFIVRPETWGIQNVIRTGPKDFSRQFVTNVSSGGLLPDHLEYMVGHTTIKDKRTDKVLELPEEADALELIGHGWVEPDQRYKLIRGR